MPHSKTRRRGKGPRRQGAAPPREQSEEEQEQEHFAAVVIAMLAHGALSQRWLDALEHDPVRGVAALPAAHAAALRAHTPFFARLDGLRAAVAANEAFLRTALADDWAAFAAPAALPPAYGRGGTAASEECVAALTRAAAHLSAENRALALGAEYADRVRSTLVQLARDWSAAGAGERAACYAPMLAALEARWPDARARRGVRVLNPGAGLGRLVFEAAARGFAAQGNEFSVFMLLVSNFVLNRADAAEAYTVHPFVRQNTNVRCAADQLRAVRIPDVLPRAVCAAAAAAAAAEEEGGDAEGRTLDMSMTAGDFLDVYAAPEHAGAWDALLTPFFIDTAHDVLAYLELFARIVRPGGVWINCGPLLWHFADTPGELSLELTWEELRPLVAAHGFRIVEERSVDCPYAANPRSLLSCTYHAIYFVAVREGAPADSPSTP